MKYILSVCLFILCSCSSQTNSKQVSVPFELTPQGHIIFKATVNGVEGNFIFDTGAGLNLFLQNFVDKISIKPLNRRFTAHRSTGEPIRSPLYTSDEINIGGKVYNDMLLTVVDLNIKGIDGILSLQMFKETDIVIDYTQKQLRFGEIDNKKNHPSIDIQVSDFADNALDIFTYVRIDDRVDAQVMLDAGAGADVYWLNRDLMDTLKFNYEEFLITEKTSEFNPIYKTVFYKGKIQSISNSFDTLVRPTVSFVDGLIYDGKVSINWLGTVIGISVKDKKLYQINK